jgi:hypothetical protein
MVLFRRSLKGRLLVGVGRCVVPLWGVDSEVGGICAREIVDGDLVLRSPLRAGSG